MMTPQEALANGPVDRKILFTFTEKAEQPENDPIRSAVLRAIEDNNIYPILNAVEDGYLLLTWGEDDGRMEEKPSWL